MNVGYRIVYNSLKRSVRPQSGSAGQNKKYRAAAPWSARPDKFQKENLCVPTCTRSFAKNRDMVVGAKNLRAAPTFPTNFCQSSKAFVGRIGNARGLESI